MTGTTMNGGTIRRSFLDFFAARDHRAVASAPLVPHGDPTLLFTNAGMVQFKDSFLGLEAPPHRRVVTVQKCLRVSGKHNDLENVGPSPRHHTFFEMLGNFSFGDYFKDEAIRYGWQLVTEVWELPARHLFATVFREDDEAFGLWRKISGLGEERIRRCGEKDNFWAMGDTGPCGPCSEIFVDRAPGEPEVDWQEGTESGRYLEIWNLVFMQYERDASGSMKPLPDPSIDTGAGLERVAAVLQGVDSNYDTDLFQPLLAAAAELAGTAYGREATGDVSLRVIADHLRAVSFLLADGVIPAPDGRGYVLRRLLRRAVRHGMRLGFEEPFLHRLVPVVGEVLGDHYTELAETREATVATVRAEEEKYLATLAAGARRVQEALDRARAAGQKQLPGEELFRLYDTHGLELEAVREIAEEEQLGLDVAGFEEHLAARRAASREATGELQKRIGGLRAVLHGQGELAATAFDGYERLLLADARVVARAVVPATAGPGGDDQAVLDRSPSRGERGVVVLDRTVFYAESGGQVGDRGTISWEGGRAVVEDTQKDTSGVVLHFLRVEEGSLDLGTRVALEVDRKRRRAAERNHTATHLLHAALRQELGEGVRQAGSLVAPERLRFDFTYDRPVEPQALRRIERLANGWIRDAVATRIAWRGRQEALAAGAMALFGEKYGEEVRTVEVPGASLELCGGCHVRNTGEIGLLLVTAERGVASGVRRIEAVTGEGALELVAARQELLERLVSELAVPAERLPEEAAALKLRLKELERELAHLRLQLVSRAAEEGPEAAEVGGVKLLAREVPTAPAGELRTMADTLRDKLGSGVVVLGAKNDGKVSLVVTVSRDLTDRLNAGRLVKALAPVVGGSGGGRPDFAQAGGREPERLGELLAAVPGVVADALGAPGRGRPLAEPPAGM